jgi:aminopeptidase N
MKLVDVSTRGQFVARLGAGSREASMITKLDNYAKKYLAPTDRAAVDESIAQIKARLERDPRVKKEAAAWVMANLK